MWIWRWRLVLITASTHTKGPAGDLRYSKDHKQSFGPPTVWAPVPVPAVVIVTMRFVLRAVFSCLTLVPCRNRSEHIAANTAVLHFRSLRKREKEMREETPSWWID